VDLGVAAAVASSFREQRVAADTVLIGEVGLGGEIRTVTRTEARIREAAKLGFRRCVLPKSTRARPHLNDSTSGPGIELAQAGTLVEALELALE
jgi:DNA repair protein RadA/Sms